MARDQKKFGNRCSKVRQKLHYL